MSLQDLAAARWSGADVQTAVAVALAESGGRLDADCLNCAGVPEHSCGPWQVNVNVWTQFDPGRLESDWDYTADAAYYVWSVQGWSAWSTYTSGAYRAFLSQDAPTPLAATGPQPQPARTGLLLAGAALGLFLIWHL